MSWIAIAVAGWLLGSVALALLIGSGIRIADRRAREGAQARGGRRPALGGQAVVAPVVRDGRTWARRD